MREGTRVETHEGEEGCVINGGVEAVVVGEFGRGKVS